MKSFYRLFGTAKLIGNPFDAFGWFVALQPRIKRDIHNENEYARQCEFSQTKW